MANSSDSFRVNDAVVDWMQEIAPFGIFTTDADLRITSWNRWLVEHSGYAAKEVIGRLLLELFPDLHERRLAGRYQRALAGEISVVSTALHKYLLALPSPAPAGEQQHMLQTGRVAPLRENDTVIGTITIIEDVTQREVQARVLNRQQELDRLLSSSLAQLLQSTEPKRDVADIFGRIGRTLGIDAYFCYLLNAERSELQLHCAAGIPPRQREAIAGFPVGEVEAAAGSPATSLAPFCLPRHDEALERFGLAARCSFPLVASERVVGFVTFANYQKAQIPASDVDVLSRVARYIGIALERAARERDILAASRAKDDFLATLSHELRTPLNPVLLLASEAADNEDFPAQAREEFREIERNALVEARLIDDLLDLTRIEHGKLAVDLRPIDAHAPIRDALETIRPEMVEKSIHLTLQLEAQPSIVRGDPGRLQQVCWNVLRNAVKFSPVAGNVTLRTHTDAATREFVLEVSDQGIGMEPHEVARIFGAFAQGDHATEGRSRRFGGLGLGLAITRKVVEMHAGRISAHSAGRNQGSTFTIRLPLESVAEVVPITPPTRGMKPREEPTAPRALPAAHILVVEDHEPTRTALAHMMVRRGYAVVSVATAQAALREAAATKFDLVLSDIGLPDADGLTLMSTLRDRHGMRGIAISGYGTETDVSRSADAGFVAHLTKPVSMSVLEDALTQFFGPAKPRR